MKRIILTGAQGTGKTTILNHFKEQGMNCITEVVRNLAKEGVKINEMGDEEGQRKIFDTYVDLLSQKESYISDRGLTDVMAYTMYLNKGSNMDSLFFEQMIKLQVFMDDNKDIIYCYFPIEFAVVNDGVRSMDEEFRKKVDVNIKKILEVNKIPYHTITGTVEERIKQLEELLK